MTANFILQFFIIVVPMLNLQDQHTTPLATTQSRFRRDTTLIQIDTTNPLIIDDFGEPPKLLEAPKVTYPKEALSYGKNARVLVKVLIDTLGVVRNAVVVRSPDPAFNNFAIELGYKFRFVPGKRVDGQKYGGWLVVPIDFKRMKKY